MPLRLVHIKKDSKKHRSQAQQALTVRREIVVQGSEQDQVAKCIFDALSSQATSSGVPKAFHSVYVNERVHTYLLFDGTFDDAEALCPHFPATPYESFKNCPAKICVLYCARMPDVFTWTNVKHKQDDAEFVQSFLTNFKSPIQSSAPKKLLSADYFKKICL